MKPSAGALARQPLSSRSKHARAVLQKNLSLITEPAAGEIIGLPVHAALPLLQGRGEAFDLIFIDPPYGKGLAHATLETLAAGTLCSKQGIILCEHFIRDAASRALRIAGAF